MKNKTLLFSLFILLFSCSANCANKELVARLWERPEEKRHKTDLKKADLSYEKLQKIQLPEAELDESTFFKSNLTKANFFKSTGTFIKFNCTNLQDANFENATFKQADFSANQGAFDDIKASGGICIKKSATFLQELWSALKTLKRDKNFSNIDLWNLLNIYEQSLISSCRCGYLFIPLSLYFEDRNRMGINFKNATLSFCDFRHTYLIGANFENAVLYKANLGYTVLYKAHFDSKTNLEGAIFTNANLEEAIVDGADFSKAILSEEQKDYLRDHGAILD